MMSRAASNPFRSECLDRLPYRLVDQTWEALLARLAALRYRAAIIGRHGSGKTTLLEALVPHVERIGFRVVRVTLNNSHPALTSAQQAQLRELRSNDLLLLDGAEQLSFLSWMQIRWRAQSVGGILITSHQPGRLPTLIECRPTLEVAGELVRELSATSIDQKLVAVLFDKHKGNIREVLRELYDTHST